MAAPEKTVDEPVDWLILGDSSVNQGVIPSIFEDEFGERAINLGTNGIMITLDDLWMIEYLHAKIRSTKKCNNCACLRCLATRF
jgi:hypothetical protein